MLNTVNTVYTFDTMQIILQVRENKTNGQKYINVPKNTDLSPGDYVRLKKVEENE